MLGETPNNNTQQKIHYALKQKNALEETSNTDKAPANESSSLRLLFVIGSWRAFRSMFTHPIDKELFRRLTSPLFASVGQIHNLREICNWSF